MKDKLQKQYGSLESIKQFLETKTDYQVTIVPDGWHSKEIKLFKTVDKCILIKKSNSAGATVNLSNDNVINVRPVPPGSYLNTLTAAARQGVFKLDIGIIVHHFISKSQEKIANEIATILSEIKE